MIDSHIKNSLATYSDPFLATDLITAKCPIKIVTNDDRIQVEVTLGYPFADQSNQDAIKTHLQKAFPAYQIEVSAKWAVEAKTVQPGLQGIANIKNIIAVASGKGGVGKSTTAVNLALALAAEGARVGILDADIYGPNQPQMLGVDNPALFVDQKIMEPIVCHGIQSMSIGYLIDKSTPVVWRGPMVTSALLQLLNNTQWHDLDYLFIDLPPGTGDIQLTLSQKIPVCGAVIVTTPQEVALLDARKGIEMFYKVKIPVLGIIENMCNYICSHCGHQEPIFGSAGGQKIANEYKLSLLGQLPLAKQIREQSDRGIPTVVADPESDISKLYRHIGKKIAAKLSLQTKNCHNRFPKIVIENN